MGKWEGWEHLKASFIVNTEFLITLKIHWGAFARD